MCNSNWTSWIVQLQWRIDTHTNTTPCVSLTQCQFQSEGTVSDGAVDWLRSGNYEMVLTLDGCQIWLGFMGAGLERHGLRIRSVLLYLGQWWYLELNKEYQSCFWHESRFMLDQVTLATWGFYLKIANIRLQEPGFYRMLSIYGIEDSSETSLYCLCQERI